MTTLVAFSAPLFAVRRPESLLSARVEVPGTDEELVKRALGGDRQGFDELYRRHVDVIWRRLGRLIGQDPEREDLVQQIFFDVFRSLDRFRGEAAFSTFLHRVMLNTAYDHLKRRARVRSSVDPEALVHLIDPGASPEHRAEERERLAATSALLDRIKPKKRIAFVLRVVEGLSLEEIATLVDATPAAVAQRIRHAHAEIEAMLKRLQGKRPERRL